MNNNNNNTKIKKRGIGLHLQIGMIVLSCVLCREQTQYIYTYTPYKCTTHINVFVVYLACIHYRECVCVSVSMCIWFNNFNNDCQSEHSVLFLYFISLFHYCDNNFIVVILSPLFNRTIGCDCSVLLFTSRFFFSSSILFCIFYT